jgi:hypothetical protein
MRSNSALLRILGVALSGTAFACSGTSPLAPTASTDGSATSQKTAPYTAASSGASVAGPQATPILPVYVKGLIKATLKAQYILEDGTRVLLSSRTSITLNGTPVAWWEVSEGQGLYAEGFWVTDGEMSRHGVFQAGSVQASTVGTDTGPHTTPADTGAVPDPTTNRH